MSADVVKVLTDAMEKALADPGFKADFDKAKLIEVAMQRKGLSAHHGHWFLAMVSLFSWSNPTS